MDNYYGVSFKNDGKVYYFKSNKPNIALETNAIVETEKGMQFGKIKSIIEKENLHINLENIKSIIRIANDDDYQEYLSNLKEAEEAVKKATKIANELKLNMKFIDGLFTFDRKQLLLNFLADERVDFRELAKRLAATYKTRIELRQLGARDKAKEVGGIGPCGRKLCCTEFLHRIDSITMNMAKNQNLALNPTKINGVCGRLLCCLAYEDEEYSLCQNGMPYYGQTITTKEGKGQVVSVDILRRTFKVNIEGDIKEIKLDDK